jgi:hypothetical protein
LSATLGPLPSSPPIDDDQGAALAAAVAPYVVSMILGVPELRQRLADALRSDDPWFDVKRGAEYIGASANVLRKAADRRELSFEQEAPGCKMYFRRSALDAYRAGHRLR